MNAKLESALSDFQTEFLSYDEIPEKRVIALLDSVNVQLVRTIFFIPIEVFTKVWAGNWPNIVFCS